MFAATTVHVKPLPPMRTPSLAVIVTPYTPALDSVPVMVPVEGLIVRPGGRPVAAKVTGSRSGSVAEIGSVTTAPTGFD